MTPDELAKYNGKDGQPAYVAVRGVIYDVSTSPLWKNGTHERTHQAGCDLTDALKTAPHVAALIERFPSVEHLTVPPEQKPNPGSKLIIPAAVIITLLFLWLALR